MPDQVTQVQPGNDSGGGGFGSGMIIGIIVIILIIIAVMFMYGGGLSNGDADLNPPAGDVMENNFEAPNGGEVQLDVPDQVDVNVNNPE